MKKPHILITDLFYTELLHDYQKKYDITYNPKISENQLYEVIEQFDILIISTRLPIKERLIEKSKRLKLIVRMGIGVDHIDLKACEKNHITVCNTPNANVISVVEFVFGQLMRYFRNLEKLNINVIEGKFRDNLPLGEELRSKTIGVIGVGRIGKKIVQISKFFGARVLGNDPYLSKTKKKNIPVDKWLEKKELVMQSDIVTLQVPLTKETEYLVCKEFLSWMKKDSILINTSRGKVVRFNDVVDFVTNGVVKKFIFDVFEEEPFVPKIDKKLLDYFYFSPHTASYTKESLFYRSKEALEEVDEFVNGTKPHGKINFKKGY